MADIRPLCVKWHTTLQEILPSPVNMETLLKRSQHIYKPLVGPITSTNKGKTTKPHSTTVVVNSTSIGKTILMQQFTISLYLAAMMIANSCCDIVEPIRMI